MDASNAEQQPKKKSVFSWFAVTTVKLALPLIVLGGSAFGFYTLWQSRPEPPERQSREKVWVVETAAAEFSSEQPTLRVYGQTESGREVALRALAQGEVVSVAPDLRVGALVDDGMPLVTIDSFDYEGRVIEARASLLEAEARLREIEAMVASERRALDLADEQRAFAARDLERADALRDRGTLSERALDDRRLLVSQRQQSVDQRKWNIEIQQAKADQQRASIDRFRRQLAEAERALENTVLTAPFSGYVAEVNAEVGRLMNASDVAVRLIDRQAVEVSFTLSDRQFGRIVEAEGDVIGRPIDVNWYLGDSPISFEGRIARLSPQISAVSGGVKIFATINPGETGNVLRPGAFVEVLVPDRTYDAVVTVPERSIYPGDTIFLVEDDRLTPREIEVVGFSETGILIRGDLEADDRILLTKITEAGEGLRVRDLSQPEGDGSRTVARRMNSSGDGARPAGAGPDGERGQRQTN